MPWLSVTLAQAAEPTPPTVEELLRSASVSDAALSPDGERVAILREQTEGGKRKAIVVLTKADGSAAPVRVVIGDHDVKTVEWASNERLLVTISMWKSASGEPYGFSFYGFFLPYPLRRIIAIGVDGSNPLMLFADQAKVLKSQFDLSRVVDYMWDDPQHILMQIWSGRHEAWSLQKVDVHTGKSEQMELGTTSTDFWMTQRGVPMMRFDSTTRGTVSIQGRAPGETAWKLIRKARRDELDKLPDFDVAGPTPAPGVFLVAQAREGEDARVLRTFDIATLQFGEVVAQRPSRDIEEAIIDEDLKLLATAYREDRLEYQFVDPKLAAHFRGVNSYFGNTCNVRLYDMNLAHTRFIFNVTGPKDAGAFYMYDTGKRAVEAIGDRFPWLPPERLAGMEALKLKARDGTALSAYLSTPIKAAKGPLPMLVMPHGGPELRDKYDYDFMVQAFAAQGWLVLQPNFRGSGGLGRAFADAGRKRWADLMQEDVEDAVAHVVALGRADPKRLAILGSSYGGYAALMGTVRKPDLYKAAVSIAGPSDLLTLMATVRREEGADSLSYAYWLKTIGDPRADEALLIRGSPARRAGEITTPVLLMLGTEDSTVRPSQSKTMADAMFAAGKGCEHVLLKGEGHTGWQDSTWTTVVTQSAKFISKYI
ncbi:MAG: alpha/beta fold hydrolase [Phenylobacterium sp.]|uniref:S9 family peptidase n=1 Tax=Phenylobacterium sp. TaxID=1871053 RepID=UPI00271E0B79|nr:alpha/beta fold hydrolase [Phenylobacterium sp.]MDO8913218.1 alpha/beta fold hydrolase [Phenylobacterium sp.]MDP3100062.1 alpha/beta fold hydrolase [Phenylobacterium sp.]